MKPSNRAVSTSVDVIIALVVLSGAITMLFVYGGSSSTETQQDEEEADQLADLLSTATVEVNYTVWITVGQSTNRYEFTESGTILHHLRRATMLNATFRTDGTPQALSLLPPCEAVANDYQGVVKEEYLDEKSVNNESLDDDWYSNNRRFPPRFYNGSTGKIKHNYQKYRFRAFKPKYINDSAENITFADAYTDGSGNLSDQYLNDDDKPKMELSIDVLRSEVEDQPCNPTGALHPEVRENYNATEPASLTTTSNGRTPFVRTNYMQKIDAAIDQRLRTELEGYRIETTWQPFDRADGKRPYIASRNVIGDTPDRDQETNSARLVVPSGLPDATEIEKRQRGTGLAGAVGAAIAEGYFPRAESKYALERGETSQAYVTDRYLRIASIASESEESELGRGIAEGVDDPYSADTNKLRTVIAALLTQKFSEQDIATADEDHVRQTLSTGKVDVVVMTWEEEE